MSQPCDGVRFTGPCAVLDQVILCGAVLTDIGQQSPDDIKLVVPREDNVFRLLCLAGQLVFAFLCFDKDELADEVKNGILFENILPHVGNAVLVIVGRISGTGIDAFSIAHVKRQEEG